MRVRIYGQQFNLLRKANQYMLSDVPVELEARFPESLEDLQFYHSSDEDEEPFDDAENPYEFESNLSAAAREVDHINQMKEDSYDDIRNGAETELQAESRFVRELLTVKEGNVICKSKCSGKVPGAEVKAEVELVVQRNSDVPSDFRGGPLSKDGGSSGLKISTQTVSSDSPSEEISQVESKCVVKESVQTQAVAKPGVAPSGQKKRRSRNRKRKGKRSSSKPSPESTGPSETPKRQ
jgi:hypothetical protein